MNLSAQAPTQLQSADPADWKVAPGWHPLVEAFFADARGQALRAFLQSRLQAGATIFPPQPLRALDLTPPAAVRVAILRQDPYHGRGQAAGLALFLLRRVCRCRPRCATSSRRCSATWEHLSRPCPSPAAAW